MTYAMHMQKPGKLWRDLGPWRFFGVQALFLGALSQFVLAPFLWSFWMFPLGLPHPMRGVLPHDLLVVLGAVFLFSEVITIATSMVATSTSKHKLLWPWVPTLHFYYPLATLAALKGLWEVVSKPYYWDKTAHGIDDHGFHEETEAEAPLVLSDPIAPEAAENAPFVLKKPLISPGNAPANEKRAPLVLYPPRDEAPMPLREVAEAARPFVFERLQQEGGGSAPVPGRRLTFGLDLSRGAETPALRRAMDAATVALDPERLRPAPQPDIRPTPEQTEELGVLTTPAPPPAVNAPGAPDWAHVAAFAETPDFVPGVSPIDKSRNSA